MKSLREILGQKPKIVVNPSFSCEKCLDTGWLDDGESYARCPCREESDKTFRQRSFIKDCGLPLNSRRMTFETFKPKAETKSAYNAAKEMADNKGTLLLMLRGGTGCGKTHLAIAVCHEKLKRGEPAVYVYVPELLAYLRDAIKDDSYRSRYLLYRDVGFLVLDDLGAEKSTAWAVETLEALVNWRLMHNLSTMITTNIDIREISDRIYSRLNDRRYSTAIQVGGPDYRTER